MFSRTFAHRLTSIPRRGGLFLVLTPDTGEITYINAGHNAPIVSSFESATSLGATGTRLGLFMRAEYEARRVVVRPGDRVLLFTDGLTDA